nr:MAG: hypothetical protein DIU60_25160 [Actinomycetota bacterium]
MPGLLAGHPAATDAGALLLGCGTEWRAAPVGDGPATPEAVTALLAAHPAAAEAVAALAR